MKKLIAFLLILSLLAALLIGCGSSPKHQAQDDEDDEADAAEEDDATETDGIETDAEEPSDEPTEPTDPSDEPVEPSEPSIFTMTDDQSCNHFTNGTVDIMFRNDGSVVRANSAAEQMETLFTIAPNDEIYTAMIGVTDDRLYFGWNEVEDWWGVNVYSVDYRGENRQEFGSAWDPYFEGGWLVLLGFRSDVSSTEMLLINRYDEVVAEDQTGAVWDAMVLDESVYYVMVEDIGEDPWSRDDMVGKWSFDLLRADPDGDVTTLKVFENRTNYYTAAFFNGTVLCFYEMDEFYDVRTLEPTSNPYAD